MQISAWSSHYWFFFSSIALIALEIGAVAAGLCVYGVLRTRGKGTYVSFLQDVLLVIGFLAFVPLVILGGLCIAIVVALVYAIGKLPGLVLLLSRSVSPDHQPVVLTFLIFLLGLLLYRFKIKHQLWYGVLELSFAIACAMAAAPKLRSPTPELNAWTSLAAAAYLIVRGSENSMKGAPNSLIFRLIKQLGVNTKFREEAPERGADTDPTLAEARSQLEEYLKGRR